MEYFSCPLLFIPRTVNEFLDMRNYLEKFPHTAPAYNDRDPRYVAFDGYFSSKLAEYSEMVKRGE